MTGPEVPERELPVLAELLRQVTGESPAWAERIKPATRLEDDLRLESVEFAELSELLRGRYGDRADLAAHLSGLDVDELIALTVADLLGWLAGVTGARQPVVSRESVAPRESVVSREPAL